MPGAVLIEDKFDSPLSLGGRQPQSPPPPPPLEQQQQQQQPPSRPSALRHYIPVLARSLAPSFDEGDPLSPLRRRPAGVCLNVNALPDMYAEDGSLLVDAEPFTQWSPVSAAYLANVGVSPKSLSTLSALGRFLPSNLDRDGSDALQYDMYSGDQFRMYEFKVKKCTRGRSHDWTECPFAHPGEKARRRDPRVFNYVGVLCADYKKGSCRKGDACDLAHGVFECWLHPTRYRTQPCKDGRGCRRRICFFAHTADQLRDGSPPSPSPPSPLTAFICPASREMPVEGLDLPGSFPSNASCKLMSNSQYLLASSSLPGSDAFLAPSLSPKCSPFELSPSASPLPSPYERPIDFSPGGGLSTCRLPVSMPGELSQSLHFNHSEVGKASHNQAPLHLDKTLYSGSRGLTSLTPSSLMQPEAIQASQKMEDLVRLMRLVDLPQDQEPVWKDKLPSMLPQEQFPLQSQCARNVPVKLSEKYRNSDDFIFGRNFFEDDEEPRLERVESGKGLRAQIFESLMSSASSAAL